MSGPSPGGAPDADGQLAPAWHPDPTGRFEYRWFNGVQWTADVATGGRRLVDAPGQATPSTWAAADTSAPEVDPARRVAVGAAVCGVVGLALSWLPLLVVIGIPAAFVGIALGVLGVRRAATAGAGSPAAVVGLVSGILALGASGIGIAATRTAVDEFRRYADPGPFTIEITECRLEGTRAVATGTLRNDRSVEIADFVVNVAFRNESSRVSAGRAELDDVEPGRTRSFEVSAFVGELDQSQLRCRVDEVTGPLPFGLGR